MIKILGLKALRIAVIAIGYLIICYHPNSSNSFFETLFIFSGGLLYDYASLAYNAKKMKNDKKPGYRYQRFVSSIGCFASILFLFLAIIGLMTIFQINEIDKVTKLVSTPRLMIFQIEWNFTILLKVMGILPFLTVLELFNKHERNYDQESVAVQ